MGNSPEKSKPSARNTTEPGQPAVVKILHRKILYCGSVLVVLLACVASWSVLLAAQEERPQITPGERKVPRKKDAGPRALGVLQLTANDKATLVPVAILIGGKFWDATAYKADPIPMALETGTVYEAERAGSSMGLFTVNSALHSSAVNVQSPWLGTGKWLPAGVDKEKTGLKAEAVPVGIDTSDEPPRLTRNPAKDAPAGSPAANTAPSSSAPQSTTPSASEDGPPRLTKSDPAPPAASPTPGETKPKNTKPSDAKTADPPTLPQSDSGANAANRPRLRRGKPVDPLPEDEVPGYSKPGAAASASVATPTNTGNTPEANTDRGPIQSIPAISDATGPQPRSFAFEWLKNEEGERRLQMTALAKEQVRNYVDARAKAKITPKPAGSQAVRTAAKAKDPILENVQMSAYDLWITNQPVLVLSADAHMPPPPAGIAHAGVDSDLQYSIVLVAYPDIYNNLHKIYVGVTDKYHLDMTPRLELVDAVDADGDGRGELLFRETSDGGNGWVIYRASQDKLWKLFDSLRPE